MDSIKQINFIINSIPLNPYPKPSLFLYQNHDDEIKSTGKTIGLFRNAVFLYSLFCHNLVCK